jgi:hypothetical protein
MNRSAFTFGMGSAVGLFIGQNHSDKVEFFFTAIKRLFNPQHVDVQNPCATAETLLAFSTNTASKNKFAVLSTLNSEPEKGMISSRAIQPFEVEYENDNPVIYFNTNKLTR